MSAVDSHIALLPSAGMGHLAPFLRLAAALNDLGCTVTLITTVTTVSAAESQHLSRFFSAFPRVRACSFHLLPFDPSTASSTDPFFLQFEAIRRSVDTIPPLLSSLSPPLSAFVADIFLTSVITPLVASLPFPTHILFTSSAGMLALVAHFPFASATGDRIDIPGLLPLPISTLPPLLANPAENLFKTQTTENGHALSKITGAVVINTFDALEPETLTALNGGAVVPGLAPVVAVGPLRPCAFEQDVDPSLTWLDAQPERSVVYVSFGSRTTLGHDQIKQLALGLEKSGYRFLWVVKSKVVDREEEDEEADALVGGDSGFLERVGEQGKVVRGWVNQWKVLDHAAVGGFLSHCGWNSVMEAALQGVPMLAWPQHGDQKINAEVVEKMGWGIWERRWGWSTGSNGTELVMGDEIADRLRELMTDAGLRESAAHVREEARRAVAAEGSSTCSLINILKLEA